MRNRILILIVFLYSSLYYNCLSDKTCSDEDRACNPQSFLFLSSSLPDGIYMYSTFTKYSGDLASHGIDVRTGADNICRNERVFSNLLNIFCPEVRAFVPTTEGNLYDFPASYGVSSTLPIYGPSGLKIGNDWPSILDGSSSLNMSLYSAGLGAESFWGFSLVGGTLALDRSSGTQKDNETEGSIGSATVTSSDWLNPPANSTATCNTTQRVICICYTPDTSGL